MKKVIATLIVSAVLIMVLAGCRYHSLSPSKTTSTPTTATASVESSSAANPGSSGMSADSQDNSSSKQDSSGGAKKKISSPSLLTNEMTGKGVISYGDSAAKVKQTLAGYLPSSGPTSPYQDITTQYGGSFFFGDVTYSFDTDGRLIGMDSAVGGGPFETSKGLKIGDPLSKVFSLYGKTYTYNDGGQENPSSYTYTFGGNGMTAVVDGNRVIEICCGVIPNN